MTANLYDRVQDAVRGPAGAGRVADWQVRDLAPDVVRIELARLPDHDARHLLRSMALAVVDVHGADPGRLRAAQADAAGLSAAAFKDQVDAMRASLREDFHAWRAG